MRVKTFHILILTVYLLLSLPAASLALFLGPYSGEVIDSQTGEPVEGASVLVYWEKRIPIPPTGGSSELLEMRLVYTDKKGRYEIRRIFATAGLLGFLESTNLIVYQPGYQACIVKIYHDSPYSEPDPSFKATDNLIKIERIPPNFSHGKHYQKIEQALWGIRIYSERDDWISWNRALEMNLKAIPEKEEFLRRVEWEYRRGLSEGRQ